MLDVAVDGVAILVPGASDYTTSGATAAEAIVSIAVGERVEDGLTDLSEDPSRKDKGRVAFSSISLCMPHE